MDNFEKQQLSNLRRLAKKYGMPVVGGILLVLAVLVGQNIYQQNRATHRTEATALYNQFTEVNFVLTEYIKGGNVTAGTEVELLENMELFAQRLRADHPNTGYATYATLKMGGEHALRDDTEQAERAFQWAIANAKNDVAQELGSIFLARLLLEKGDAEQAAALLNNIEQETALVAELRGDILRARQQTEEAIAAYNLAKELGANADFINYKLSLLKQPG